MNPNPNHPPTFDASTADESYRDALAFLYQRLNYERTDSMPYDPATLKLDRMRRLLELVGNPHDSLDIVHIAGTKGKGSTAHFVRSILTQAGYRTGCYTSPHLTSIEERFAVDGQPCAPADIVHWVDFLRPYVERMDRVDGPNGGPTFFELATAIALLHFRERNVDFTVLEVGLGGRLDSTNVCAPRVSVITSISFDHMRQLGNTLEAIAAEKAGIIKPGVPVITGVTQDEPWRVIDSVAARLDAPVERLGRDFDFQYYPPKSLEANDGPRMDYRRRRAGQWESVATRVSLSTLGAHQAANAALACATCDALVAQGLAIPLEAMLNGLANGRCAARIEVWQKRPAVVIDTAHNGASIQALVRVLRESFPHSPRTLLLAATQGKDVDEMLHALVPEFDTIVCTQYLHNPRGMPVDELMRHTRRITTAEGSVVDLVDCPSPQTAWNQAVRCTPSTGLICVTGSFFLAAEMQIIMASPTPAKN